MTLLRMLDEDQGFLKAGFMGFQKSGKTYTATQLAIGTRDLFQHHGPIAMFDTEGGSTFVKDAVLKATGKPMLGYRGRSFTDLMTMAGECEKEGVSVLIVDSVTHIWRELCDAYLAQVNRTRKERNLPPRGKLEFQDWGNIKAKWAVWADWFLNSPMHVIIAGRAGYDYDMEANEETGRKELVKTGTKMKAEGEFGYEPSLLIEMERIQAGGKKTIIHRATVLGDRFGVIDGKQCDDPTFAFFAPHVKRLVPGAHTTIDTANKTDFDVTGDGDAAFARERREKTVVLEEIQHELLRAWPGQTAAEKKAKAAAVEAAFNTGSWTKVEGMPLDRLRDGFKTIRTMVDVAVSQAVMEASK